MLRNQKGLFSPTQSSLKQSSQDQNEIFEMPYSLKSSSKVIKKLLCILIYF